MVIDDIERNQYCFTDGNGLVSQGLAGLIAERLSLCTADRLDNVRFLNGSLWMNVLREISVASSIGLSDSHRWLQRSDHHRSSIDLRSILHQNSSVDAEISV